MGRNVYTSATSRPRVLGTFECLYATKKCHLRDRIAEMMGGKRFGRPVFANRVSSVIDVPEMWGFPDKDAALTYHCNAIVLALLSEKQFRSLKSTFSRSYERKKMEEKNTRDLQVDRIKQAQLSRSDQVNKAELEKSSLVFTGLKENSVNLPFVFGATTSPTSNYARLGFPNRKAWDHMLKNSRPPKSSSALGNEMYWINPGKLLEIQLQRQGTPMDPPADHDIGLKADLAGKTASNAIVIDDDANSEEEETLVDSCVPDAALSCDVSPAKEHFLTEHFGYKIPDVFPVGLRVRYRYKIDAEVHTWSPKISRITEILNGRRYSVMEAGSACGELMLCHHNDLCPESMYKKFEQDKDRKMLSKNPPRGSFPDERGGKASPMDVSALMKSPIGIFDIGTVENYDSIMLDIKSAVDSVEAVEEEQLCEWSPDVLELINNLLGKKQDLPVPLSQKPKVKQQLRNLQILMQQQKLNMCNADPKEEKILLAFTRAYEEYKMQDQKNHSANPSTFLID